MPERRVRELLDRIAAAERRENEFLEETLDEAAAEFLQLPKRDRVPALLGVVGASSARRRLAVHLLCAAYDDSAAREVMRIWIADPDPDVRAQVIQIVGAAGIEELAPLLADRIADDDDLFCRDMAVHAAGRLRADVCLPAILDLVETDFSRWRLAQVLACYATEDVRPYLNRWFADEGLDHDVRLQAAWGLAKLGDARAVEYLARGVLDGEGVDRFRCAQALCEIKGWPFEWHADSVEQTAELLRAAG